MPILNRAVLQTAEQIVGAGYKCAIIVLAPMANYKKLRENSFTIIELIIVVTFILLFTGFSVGYYAQYTEQKNLKAQAIE